MSRRHHATGPAVSLFPFLAVLLCTMGALLVLLVLFSRAAEDGRTAQATAAAEARLEELELAHEELAWRLEQLALIREQTTDDLARARLQLAGIEDDSRTLADEFETLDETLAAVESAVESATPVDAARLADLETRLADARDVLEATRRDGSTRPPAYAVVPYEGQQGTRRRPLYIECCIDGVFLQPEGIRLGPGDFEGPPGPGNPLASALRAAREHIAMHADGGGDPDVQPYPLLLVRPSGVMAYYAAREAIVSWGNEFGYQFIDEDWDLEFPPSDPALAAAETRAVEEARRRLEWLAQVRPPQPTKPTQQYRAATTRGGIVAEGGPTVLGDRSRFDWTEEDADRSNGRGSSRGRADTASALGSGGAGGGGIGSGTHAPGQPVGGSGLLGGNGSAAGDTAWGDARATGAAGGATGGERYAGPSRFYSGHAGTDGAEGAGPGGANGPGGGLPGESGSPPTLLVSTAGAGGPSGTADGAGGAAADASTGGTSRGNGDGTGAGGGAAEAGGGTEGSAAGGAAGGAAGAAQAGTGGAGGGTSMPTLVGAGAGAAQESGGASGAAASFSFAGSRGANWASLATHDRPVPLTRPVKLECASDEFRLLGEDGRVEERIPIGTHTADAIDPLVRAVHSRVRRWGIAGDRMYWRPELVITATADGGGRRDDLERLLADSGLDTRRSERGATVRPLPPVRRPRGLFSSRPR